MLDKNYMRSLFNFMPKKTKLIRLSKSCIGVKEINAVTNVLKGEFLGMGEQVREFEDQLTQYFGRPAVCVVNGTAALHLALQSIGLKSGDEVLVQSLTYVASIQAIYSTNAKAIFCDVVPDSLTIDLEDAEKRITNRTKAIIPVHYAGGVGDLNNIYKFAKKHNLRVVEDAAHAFGTSHENKLIGSFGDITCFSFDGIKNITSGEGGCVLSDDKDVISKIKDSRLLGVEKDTENRYRGKRSWEFDVKTQGWRYHMSNIMGAIGLEQLKRFPKLSNKRKQLAKKYFALLKNTKDINLLNLDLENVVMHIFPVVLKKVDVRDKIRIDLKKEGIETGIHYFPNHLLTYFSLNPNYELKVTENLFNRLLTLPLHPDLSEKDLEYIVEKFISILNKYTK